MVMKSAEDGRRYDAAHVLDRAIDRSVVCTENLVRIDLMRESLNFGHDGRADISLRAGIYKDLANKANVKIGQRKCHITST